MMGGWLKFENKLGNPNVAFGGSQGKERPGGQGRRHPLKEARGGLWLPWRQLLVGKAARG